MNRYLLVLFGILQNTLAGGVIYGWTGIAGSILITPPSLGGAGLSPTVALQISSIASSISCVSQLFPLGILQDSFGPRICSVFSNLVVGLGCFVFVACSNSDIEDSVDNDNGNGNDNDNNNNDDSVTSWPYFVGAILMGLGGPGVQMSVLHLGNLFPGRENLVMSCITNSITLSFGIFPFFSYIWSLNIQNGNGNNIGGGDENANTNTDAISNFHFAFLFRLLGILIWGMTLISLWIWPDVPFNSYDSIQMLALDETEDGPRGTVEAQAPVPSAVLSAESSLSSAGIEITDVVEEQQNPNTSPTQINSTDKHSKRLPVKELTFRHQLFSGKLFRLALFFTITSFWANFYVASLTVELKDERQFQYGNAKSDETGNERDAFIYLIQVFSYIQVGGMFVSPLVGHLLDTIGWNWTSIITCLLGIGQLLLLFLINFLDSDGDIDTYLWKERIMILSFVVYCFFRSFLYPCFFSPVAVLFGFKNFGALSGIVVAVSGISFLVLAVPVSAFAIGTCHLLSIDSEESAYYGNGDNANELSPSCLSGRWKSLHTFQFASLALLIAMQLFYRRDDSEDFIEIRRSINNTNVKKGAHRQTSDLDNQEEFLESKYGSVRNTTAEII